MTALDLTLWDAHIGVLHERLNDVDRAGVVVVGAPGSGTTSLVQVLLRDGVGPTSLTVQCGPALVNVPYGALSPYLTGLEAVRGPVDVLAAVQRHLDVVASTAPDGTRLRPVIVVEDCQFLDAASAFVLALLAQNREAVLLATSVGLRGESGLGALVDTGLLATVTMPALGLAETSALCTAVVGARPTGGAAATILGMTGGMPGLVVAFLASADEQGILVGADGETWTNGGPDRWTLLRPAPAVDERLVGVVEGMQSELTDQQQTAVTMLALVGRMPAAELRVAVGDQVQDLWDTHVVRGTTEGDVELSAELYGEVVRAITPPGRGADLMARRDAPVAGHPRREPARSLVRAVENGLPVPDEERVAAGYELLAARDLAGAWFLATRPAAAASDESVVLRADVMLAAGRSMSGRTDLVEVADRTQDVHLLSEVLAALAMDRVQDGASTTPWSALAEVWLERQDRALRTGGSRPAATGSLEAWWSALDRVDVADESARIVDLSSAVAADPDAPSSMRCVARWVRGCLRTRAGRLVDAADDAAQAYALVSGNARMSALLGVHAVVHLVEALLLVGDLDGAARVLADQRGGSAHRSHAWAGTLQALDGFLELARGRVRPGRRVLRDATPDLDQWDPVRLRPLVTALEGVSAAPPAGGPGGDTSLADRVRDAGNHGRTERRLLASGVAEVVDDAGRENTPGSPAAWVRIVRDSQLAAHPAVALEILLVASAVRDPDTADDELVAAIHRAGVLLDGPRADVVVRAYDPAIAQDPVRLAQVAAQAMTEGFPVIAADTWARVVRLHDRANDLRRRGEALRHLHGVVGELGGAPGRYVRSTLDLGALTPRELEIVRLTLEGRRSGEIARTLVVSPRTVEGHLYRVFAKLGINDRTELRDVWR